MKDYQLTYELESYIAQPYWPERYDLIQITKKSGMDRARSEEKRELCLMTYLHKLEMTHAQFLALKATAEQPWYRTNRADQTSPIVIPRHQFAGMLVQACQSAPSGAKFKPDALRSQVRLCDEFVSNKTTHDEISKRWVKPEVSHERRLTTDVVLKHATFTGTLTLDPDATNPEAIETLIKHGLFFVGVGAARKMGFGRGKVVSFAEAAELAEA